MLFDGMKGMGRVFQGAATVNSLIKPGLLEKAAEAGLRSIFVGFENLDANNLRDHGKVQNLGRDYGAAVRRVHEQGVMVNGSFVFGMDEDGPDVFDRTTDWAVSQRHRNGDFPRHDALSRHRPVPTDGGRGTAAAPRLGSLRHAPHGVQTREDDSGAARKRLLAGLRAILSNGETSSRARAPRNLPGALRHIAYAGGWKKFEWVWHTLIRMKQVARGPAAVGKSARSDPAETAGVRRRLPRSLIPDIRRRCSLGAAGWCGVGSSSPN